MVVEIEQLEWVERDQLVNVASIPTHNSATSSQNDCRPFHRCGLSGCVHCDQGRANRKVPEVLDNIKAKAPRLYYLTLTLRETGYDDESASISLLDQLTTLQRSMIQLRKDAYWQSHVLGGLWRLHVAHSIHWNAHYHCIIESDAINLSEIKRAWHDATGGAYSVDLQQVKDSELDHLRLTKYVLKAPQRAIAGNPVLMAEYKQAIRGKRKMGRFGSWTNSRTNPTRWKKSRRATHEQQTYEPTAKQLTEWQQEAALLSSPAKTGEAWKEVIQNVEPKRISISPDNCGSSHLSGKTIATADWQPFPKIGAVSTYGWEIVEPHCGLGFHPTTITTLQFETLNCASSFMEKQSTCCIVKQPTTPKPIESPDGS